ncbi:MAG: hypothetical protein IJ685_09265 [Selenomonadaceae bacterium]|nr:hypothetical protein [Selenomonadaceae bacterium]
MTDEKNFVAVVELLAEGWRMNQFMEKFAARILDEKIRRKFSNQVTRFDKKISALTETFGLEIVDFTGAEFETGLPVAPINLADFAADEDLIVETMIEPTIKVANSTEIVRRGAAVLRRQVK